jgi:hypothetical protein
VARKQTTKITHSSNTNAQLQRNQISNVNEYQISDSLIQSNKPKNLKKNLFLFTNVEHQIFNARRDAAARGGASAVAHPRKKLRHVVPNRSTRHIARMRTR